MNPISSIKRYPVVAFIALAFILSVAATFAPVGDSDKFLILGALLVPIPTLVALVLSALTGGIRPFLREVLTWRIDLRWALIAFGIALGARLVISLLALLTGAIPSIQVSAASPPIIVVIYLFALLEEIGWRGFAVRRLMTHHSPFAALLITGIPWSMIHIFFYLSQGASMDTLMQVFLLNFALTVLVTWVYLRGGRKVWIGVFLHGSQSLFGIFNTNLPPDLITQYSVIVYSVFAMVILAIDWRRWFARPTQTVSSQSVQPTVKPSLA
jgi:membrane protease YdiL (CAAX protease family)